VKTAHSPDVSINGMAVFDNNTYGFNSKFDISRGNKPENFNTTQQQKMCMAVAWAREPDRYPVTEPPRFVFGGGNPIRLVS
jgi:hypothetical protein